MKRIVLAAIAVIAMSCSPKYTCQELTPTGECITLEDVYQREVLHSTGKEESGKAVDYSAPSSDRAVADLSVEPVRPLRNPPRVVRVWIAPWEDGEKDLHMESFLYMEIDRGRWALGEAGASEAGGNKMIKTPVHDEMGSPAGGVK